MRRVWDGREVEELRRLWDAIRLFVRGLFGYREV